MGKAKQREKTNDEKRIDEIRAELHELYKSAGRHPDWAEIDRLHHELTKLIERREEVVDG